MGERRAATTRRRWWYAGGGVVALGLVALALVLSGVFSTEQEQAAPKPPPSATTASPTPTPDPDVSIDETSTMPYTPVWNPPDSGEGFWQIVDPDEGYPEDGGTDYVLAHACRDGGCTGDAVRALETGDSLNYLGEEFVVEEKLEILKTEIAEQDIWEHDPDRLVVITCILDPDTGRYDENDIIVASRA